jgi:hypothetical protein
LGFIEGQNLDICGSRTSTQSHSAETWLHREVLPNAPVLVQPERASIELRIQIPECDIRMFHGGGVEQEVDVLGPSQVILVSIEFAVLPNWKITDLAMLRVQS